MPSMRHESPSVRASGWQLSRGVVGHRARLMHADHELGRGTAERALAVRGVERGDAMIHRQAVVAAAAVGAGRLRAFGDLAR